MNSNYVPLYSKESEIDKIIQEGIDNSLLYISAIRKKVSKTKKTKKNNSKTKNLYHSNKTIYSNEISKKMNLSICSQRPKSVNRTKIVKKSSHIFDYQFEYNIKKEELQKYKNQLIKERIRQNKLKKEIGSKLRKEEEFQKIEENNQMIKNSSEQLILKIQRSEKIREEQAKIIEGLIKEYKDIIKILRNNPDVEILNKYKELKSESEELNFQNTGKKRLKKRLSKKKF